MRFWVIDSSRVPIKADPGTGAQEIGIGDLAGWVETQDVLLAYETTDEYRTCVIHSAHLVIEADETTRTATVEVRLGGFSVSPSSAAGRGRWKNNPRLCLDANKVVSYGLFSWASSLFPLHEWELTDLKDAVGWSIRFDPRRPRKADEHGYVYLMRGESMYKIGKSKDPARRLSEVLRAAGREVDLLHVIESNWFSRAEWELHQRFKSKRAYLEWFYLDEQDVIDIKMIESMHYPLEDGESSAP